MKKLILIIALLSSNVYSKSKRFNIDSLDKRLQIVIYYAKAWACQNKLPFKITSAWRPYNDGISKSNTHQTHRAIDMSLKGYSKENRAKLKKALKKKFNHWGAFSKSDKKQRIIVIHNVGYGLHAHIQVSLEK